MQSESKLRGIFTPNLIPYDSRGEINEPELRRYIDWLIEKGVHGLYPNGSTGEFTRFTPEERKRIVAIIADQTRGRVPILAGAAEANVRETIKACEYYYELGIRAVAIVAPFYYKLSPASVYAYFKEIGDNTPIDVTLYNIPMFASPIDVPTIRRLAEFDRVVGIKDSVLSLGGVLGPLTVVIATRLTTPRGIFILAGSLVLFGALLAIILLKTPQQSTPETDDLAWDVNRRRSLAAQATLSGLVLSAARLRQKRQPQPR